MKLAYIEVWNENKHGYSPNQITNPRGRLLMHHTITYNEILTENIPIQNYQIVNIYNKNEYTFAINCTFYLKLFQRKYRKRFNRYKHTRLLLLRQLYGKFPRIN